MSGFWDIYGSYIDTQTQLMALPDLCQQNARGSFRNNTVENTNKANWNTETPSPYITWKNCPLKKNSIAEPGIEPGTSSSEGNEITTEHSGRTRWQEHIKIHIIKRNLLFHLWFSLLRNKQDMRNNSSDSTKKRNTNLSEDNGY